MRLRDRRGRQALALLGLSMALGQVSVWAQSGYGGPNILSRSAGYQGRGQALGPIKLRPFVNANYFYSDGLAGVPSSQSSGISIGTMRGVSVGGGLHGIKINRNSQTLLGYNGSYSRSNSFSAINGGDQNLVLTHERQLTRRWGFYTGHNAGQQSTVLRARSLLQQDQFRSTFEQSYINYNEPLDSKLYYLNSNAGLFYQKSRRMVISMDGGLFTVQRSQSGLASVRGERAQGEVSYTLSPKSSLSVLYNFNHFFFKNSFGESYIHSAQLSYGRRINRVWSAYVRGGPYRAESDRLRSVLIDPTIAQLLGQFTTIEAFHAVNHGVGAGGGVAGQGRRHSISFNYDRSVNPGNGLSLTALGETANVNYGFMGRRNLTGSAGVFHSRLTPLLQGQDRSTVINGQVRQGEFRSYGVGGGVAYRLLASLYATINVEAAKVQYDSISFGATRRTLSAGLAFSPGEVPLRWR